MSSNAGDNNDRDQCCDDGGGSNSPGELILNKKECTSCDQNNIDNITEGITSVAILNDMSACASCGKEGNSSDMNTCNKCKMVKYCNAACKKKHRSKHKKACERRVAELYDEQLFADPPPNEECPICMLPLPFDVKAVFQSCCGKVICHGCIFAMKMSDGKDLCPFCRTRRATSSEEHIERTKKLMDNGDGVAFNTLGLAYKQRSNGLAQDYRKANKLFLKAGEFGCAKGYCNLGYSNDFGRGVEVDSKKAKHYYELAAMKGNVNSRHNLGCMEGQAGNYDRAMKHFTIATRAGHVESLEMIKRGFKDGIVTKDEYANVLRVYHERHKEMKSEERDEAAEVFGLSD